MARTRLAFALAGLGGFNAHGAGFLQAAIDHQMKPDLITATSGQIVVLAAYLRNEPDLRKGLIDPKSRTDPLAQLKIALFGYPGVFAPATGETIARLLAPFSLSTSLASLTDRFLPAQIYKPARTAKTIQCLADTFNASNVGVVFNAYDPVSGEGVLYGNDAARERVNVDTSIGYAAGQKGVGPHAGRTTGKEAPIEPIDAAAIESALWLTLYGFAGMPHGRMDGAYHRSCIVAELHNFDRIVVCRPLTRGYAARDLPKSYFDVQDWNTEMWFSVGYKAEVDAMKRINRLVEKGALNADDYKFVDLREVAPETPAGYFNYFIERDEVFDAARMEASKEFESLKAADANG